MFNVSGLRSEIWLELETRRRSPEPGDYGEQRGGGDASLYGVTGAANLCAELGFDFGEAAARQAWIARVNSFQQEDGGFLSGSGPQHAASMAVIALNLLGGHPARPVKGFAPRSTAALREWLAGLDWDGTHKDFCGGAGVPLASGGWDAEWLACLCEHVAGRLDPARPDETWCRTDAQPWRVISSIYHITAAYDDAFVPYPRPEMLYDRLMRLDYGRVRDEVHRTYCTDFDYAFLLLRLAHQLPGRFAEVLDACRAVLVGRVAEWEDRRGPLLEKASTHELYCYVIGWAVMQRMFPDDFTGPGLYDTLNVPWVHRLRVSDIAGW